MVRDISNKAIVSFTQHPFNLTQGTRDSPDGGSLAVFAKISEAFELQLRDCRLPVVSHQKDT